MKVSSVFAARGRWLAVLLMAVVLIFQMACSAMQPTLPVMAPTESQTTSSSEGSVTPAVAKMVKSPIQTPTSMVTPFDQEATSFVEETALPITTTVELAITPQEADEMPTKSNPKLDSTLSQLLEAYKRGGLVEAQAFARMHQISLDGELVQVEVVVSEETAALSFKEAIESVGGEYEGHYQTLLQALIPIGALESLAQRPDVLAIRQPIRPVIQ